MLIRLLFLFLFFGANSFYSVKPKQPALIIFDTDIAEDYDDVGALTILHVLADKGEAKILATISSNSFETTVPTISVLNDYFGRPGIPIGVTKRKEPNRPCPQGWAQAIIKNYPHHLSSNAEAREAVALYREILSRQPDNSVTIVTVGFFTNIADLLSSAPDQYSTLNGKELVNKKVKQLVSMAARLDEGKNSGKEYNVCIDTKASQKVFEEWNKPFIISPFELGEKILTGIPLTKDSTVQNSPVKDVFTIALQKDKNETGRMSWDETAVLAAVRGAEPYFTVRKLSLKVLNDCTDTLVPGKRILYLGFKMKPGEVQTVIEELMHQAPSSGTDQMIQGF
jgi:inosine-uridine nucleoside N-ribohydrolase